MTTLLLTPECAVLASVVSLARRVLDVAGRSVHLQEQVPNLHQRPRLHPEMISVDIESFNNPSSNRVIMWWDCSLLLFRHHLQGGAAVADDPVGYAATYHRVEFSGGQNPLPLGEPPPPRRTTPPG
jgi:hypothetical protein